MLKADELKGCLEDSFLAACSAAGIAIPTTFSEKLAAQLQSTMLAYLRGDQGNVRGTLPEQPAAELVPGAAAGGSGGATATNDDMLDTQRRLQMQAEVLAADAEAAAEAARKEAASKGKGQKRQGTEIAEDPDTKAMEFEELPSG